MTTPIKAKVTELNLHPIAAEQYERVLLINYGALLFIAYECKASPYNKYINVQRPDACESLQHLYEQGVALWADGCYQRHFDLCVYGPCVSFITAEPFVDLLEQNAYELLITIKATLDRLCSPPHQGVFINFAPPYTPPSC